jgi:putative ABC transport system permease protein
MLRSHLLTAVRNLSRNKGFSIINIVGLGVGLATCLLIFLYVLDELSYDRYNKRAASIYRVDADIRFGGLQFVQASAPDPMGPTLKQLYPQVEQYVRFRRLDGRFLVRRRAENFQENRVQYADSTLFKVFSLPLLQGDPATALVEPHSIVVNETVARRYFNTTDVLGKSLLVNDTAYYKITGVIRDMPTQSHFVEDIFVSMSTNPESRGGAWVMNNFNTYVLLRPGSSPAAFSTRFEDVVDKYVIPQAVQFLGAPKEAFKKDGNHVNYSLTPLTSIHLHSNKVQELGANSDVTYVYIFSAAALLILIIACVNFMNLSTACAARRAKEVGVRKALGSRRGNLIRQFLVESVLVSLIALALALSLVAACLPYFNVLSGKVFTLPMVFRPALLAMLLGLTLLVGLLAGAYPAFYLSAFVPIRVLKGSLATAFKTGWLRSAMVVFQFSISIFLIVGTAVIYDQLQYIRHKDIGYDRDQVLVLQNTDALGARAAAFRAELMRLDGVRDATMTAFLPTNSRQNEAPLFQDATLNPKSAISLQIWNVDEHYVPTLGMTMVKGRNFSAQFPTDSLGVVVNEAAAKMLGQTNPVDKKLYIPMNFAAGNAPSNILAFHVLGVVKDFNFNSLRQQVTPLAFFFGSSPENTAIRVHTTDIPALIKRIKAVWSAMEPSQPFNYSFMDNDFDHLYRAEQRIGSLFVDFAILSIFVACLGLFGLATYAAEQRSKEIGIRKVLGATSSRIAILLSSDFLRLVALSILITFPLAWWAMHRWLEGFAYRVQVGWWIFAASGVLALLIALGAVSIQTIKAAFGNPVRSLRSE